MFSQLAVGWQYLCVFLFSMLAGILALFGGGWGIWALSLAVSSGAILVSTDSWAERLLTHTTLCFWFPFLFGILLLVVVFFFCLVGFGLGMSATPVKGGGIAIIAVAMMLCIAFIPIYVPLRALHVGGGLLCTSIIGVIIGIIMGLSVWLSIVNSLNGGLGVTFLSVGIFVFLLSAVQYGLIMKKGIPPQQRRPVVSQAIFVQSVANRDNVENK